VPAEEGGEVRREGEVRGVDGELHAPM
jgi:hypothetical protein